MKIKPRKHKNIKWKLSKLTPNKKYDIWINSEEKSRALFLNDEYKVVGITFKLIPGKTEFWEIIK